MKISTRIFAIASLVFITVLGGGLYWTDLNQEIIEGEQRRLLDEIVANEASAIERQISRSLAATYILAQEVRRSAGNFPNFESYAEAVIDSVGGVSNLQLAPGGIIAKIHPLEGNETAIGHNILQDDRRRKEAILAVREKRLTLAGPFSLIQGGTGVVGRNPVFLIEDGQEKFWGFTSALILLDDLLAATDLVGLEARGYRYQLSRQHPDSGQTDVFARSNSELIQPFQSGTIEVPNAKWTLSVSKPYEFNAALGYLASLLVALSLSSMIYQVLLQPEKLRRLVDEKTGQLRVMAFYDQLTGLANRHLLYDQLERAIQQALRNRSLAALIYLDLDDFKRINDSMGHDAGDLLLQEISARFQRSLRKNDLLARLGGDEFAILMQNPESIGHVQKLADKLIEIVREPLSLHGRDVHVTATLGITLVPADGQEVSTLLRNADLALYEAKRKGKNRSVFFDFAMQEEVNRNLQLEQGLRRAIAADELFLVYQPIVHLARKNITDLEALIRWRHPQLGLLSPDQFIPVTEETGLIIPLGYEVIKLACQMIARRTSLGLEPIRVSVNLAQQQFTDPDLLPKIRDIVDATGIDPGLLQFEIVETALMDNVDSMIEIFEQMRATGISIALDDFGSGYSSLSLLPKLPIDTLKIDRSFIAGIGNRDSRAQDVVEAILALSGKLNLAVVAEGVESLEQMAFLEANGCQFAQGYLFYRPMDEAEIMSRLPKLAPLSPRKRA